MYSDQELHQTVNKITDTNSLFSMTGFSIKKSPYVVKKKPNHERAEMIEQLCTFMNDKRFTYWLGRTKHLKPPEIYDLLQKAKGGKNPQALFNWFLKKK